MSIAVKIVDKFVPISDDLLDAILRHAAANFRLGRDKVGDRPTRGREAHETQVALIEAIGIWANDVVVEVKNGAL